MEDGLTLIPDSSGDTPTRPPQLRPGAGTPGHRPQGETDTDVFGPSLSAAFLNCGIDRMQRGEAAASISDFDEAIRIDPTLARAWCLRGYARAMERDWQQAASDLLRSMEIGLTPQHEDSARLRLWVVQARLGDAAGASRSLREWFARRNTPTPAPWILRIANYLTGALPEHVFLDALRSQTTAGVEGRTCEAWYFVGEKRLSMGDTEGARGAFQKAVSCRAQGVSAWISARTALAGLQS